MRALPLLIVLGVSASASAQSLTATDQSIQTMMQRLHDRSFDPVTGVSGLSITMNGIQRQGSLKATIGSQVFFRYAPPTPSRADLRVNLVNFHLNVNGKPVTDSDVIVDGKTLWQYNPIERTYSAARFDLSPTNGPTSETYLRDGLSALNQASSAAGASSYATRLLQEMFSNSQVTYHPWIPTASGPVVVSERYQDPITLFYKNPLTGKDQATPAAKDPNVYYVVYASLPRRAVAFEIYVDPDRDISDPDRQTIQRIYITEGQTLNQKTRTTSWSIFVTPTTDFSQARFTPIASSEISDWPQWKPILAAAPVKN